MIRIGVILCGQWGRNYVRVLGGLGHAARVVEIGDRERASLAGLRRRFPPVNAVLDPEQLIENPSVDAIVIAAPATTHAGLATKALQACLSGFGYRPGDFPVAEKLAGEILSLPLFPEISGQQQQRVASVLRAALAGERSGPGAGARSRPAGSRAAGLSFRGSRS